MNNWYVCCMKGGGWFAVRCPERPDGHLIFDDTPLSVAPKSYDVIYGPCTQSVAWDYMLDVEGTIPHDDFNQR